mmetsp:Transcript_11981/g.22082  ORF Transcript_11981/g.22082 Transcript_11981/m.22082 type:complete len:330 (-) Transcript_11981:4232-5221(-)
MEDGNKAEESQGDLACDAISQVDIGGEDASDGGGVNGVMSENVVESSASLESDGQEEQPETTMVYCCQKCRCVLFHHEQLSKQHEEGRHEFAYRKSEKDGNRKERSCTSHFLSEPNKWMEDATLNDNVSGKLACPKCNNRVGSFYWAGSQCSCGTWIVPAIQFPISKVDQRVWRCDRLPDHISSIVVQTEENEEESSQDKIDPAQQRVNEHAKWIECTNLGQGDSIVAMIDKDECSLTTIQNKSFDGFESVSKVMDASTRKLGGRVKLLKGPVSLAPPSTTTRLLFQVSNVSSTIGESILWSRDSQGKLFAQHIIRVKNPTETFLQGSR